MRRLLLLLVLTLSFYGAGHVYETKANASEPSISCAWETEECASVVFQWADRWKLVVRCGDQKYSWEGSGIWPGFCPE